jgi:hypothetical protein
MSEVKAGHVKLDMPLVKTDTSRRALENAMLKYAAVKNVREIMIIELTKELMANAGSSSGSSGENYCTTTQHDTGTGVKASPGAVSFRDFEIVVTRTFASGKAQSMTMPFNKDGTAPIIFNHGVGESMSYAVQMKASSMKTFGIESSAKVENKITYTRADTGITMAAGMAKQTSVQSKQIEIQVGANTSQIATTKASTLEVAKFKQLTKAEAFTDENGSEVSPQILKTSTGKKVVSFTSGTKVSPAIDFTLIEK